MTEAEPGGQLVRCTEGELELFGHAGEWVIPADHMVYIPQGRMFRLRARVPSAGIVIQFGRGEVAWWRDGCWVGPVSEMAAALVDYGLKWNAEHAQRNRQAACFFVTLGEMLPDWFRHERINWIPYAETSAIQRAIDFAHAQGPSVSLPEVACHVGMSERTFRRRIQSELGQSWRDFIREFRMNRAMEMLRKERRSVTETAFEVGFSSSSAFSSAFLDYVGRTPSAYARSFTATHVQ
ncbi:helix-turn-helix transcriptional regulator [Phaeovulum vinaykumarii]|uniref:Transcriptional regulator, AraC family n=1 Tax=Phaeovulum vinaykumarii TaxID=407234 RepID=A0A1N7N195_9RHOB|nr:helix-turn-helix transcriptional regulator [Phaeovulum vinaykumarii]SIS91889.1 transcriptional regulator, AraC family [Phaeovulum vinaykumarii]SOC17872.1 AraC family transcriptional regulator [Phaeovulum vinaykumarii]